MSMLRSLLCCLVGSLALGVPAVVAQQTGEMPQPLPSLETTESAIPRGPAMLDALPKPPDLPASMYAPAPGFVSQPLPVNEPYFVRDPLLDLPQFRKPGWFTGAEVQFLKPHVLNRNSAGVQNPAQAAANTSITVSLGSAPLDWTAAYKVFAGYRLPSGFGEFSVSYRNLQTAGNSTLQGPNGPGPLHSRLAFQVIDLDYSSRELSCGPNWDMKWTFGIRTLALFFDSRFEQSFAQAAAGNAITVARETNNLAGVGPHAALEMARHFGDSGWFLTLLGDISSDYTWITSNYTTVSSQVGPIGRPLTGRTVTFGHQGTPILMYRSGLTWQPADRPAFRFFAGYQYERWFAVGKVTANNGTLDQLWDQGVILQASYNF
jgi:hypothetical protein